MRVVGSLLRLAREGTDVEQQMLAVVVGLQGLTLFALVLVLVWLGRIEGRLGRPVRINNRINLSQQTDASENYGDDDDDLADDDDPDWWKKGARRNPDDEE